MAGKKMQHSSKTRRKPGNPRRNYSSSELAAIEACPKRGLKALARDLGRDYDSLWRFVKVRGGVADRAKRAEKNEYLDEKIREIDAKLAEKKVHLRRSNTASEIAIAAGTYRHRVNRVLGIERLSQVIAIQMKINRRSNLWRVHRKLRRIDRGRPAKKVWKGPRKPRKKGYAALDVWQKIGATCDGFHFVVGCL